ncbi:hypothetical protein COB55_04335 [Candidatus Wolfebacteria bacterium]|nr:MAG: hypothetical protein COB55_04335 [Candidatus Wolfebacteria bacterium]
MVNKSTQYRTEYSVNVTAKEIVRVIGIEISEDMIVDTLGRLGIVTVIDGDAITCTIPSARLDLRIPHDIAEEVGRIHGLDNIKGVLPSADVQTKQEGTFNSVYQLKMALINLGFSEIITTSFSDKGDIKLENAIASDKGFMRTNLRDMMRISLDKNLRHMDLLGLDMIKQFEIGKVFADGRERLSLSLGIIGRMKEGKIDALISENIEKINATFSISLPAHVKGGVVEFDIESYLNDLPSDAVVWKGKNVEYKKYSSYPSITRDIAVWTPEGTTAEDVEKILVDNAGELLTSPPRLVDTFAKDERTSYAFRIVFQSHEKTLTDEEVNIVMQKITQRLETNAGWEVR